MSFLSLSVSGSRFANPAYTLRVVVITMSWLVMAAYPSNGPANARDGLRGCWRRLPEPPRDEFDLCFEPRGQLSGGYFEPAAKLGGGIVGVWRRRNSKLTLSEEIFGKSVCEIKFETGGDQLTMSDCGFGGTWKKCPPGESFCPEVTARRKAD